MDYIDDELKIVSQVILKRRLKKEIEELIILGYIEYCFSLNKHNNNKTNENIYSLKFFHDGTKKHYEFLIPISYPFYPPKLNLNNKPYLNYLIVNDAKYTSLLHKLSGYRCLCCETKLCGDNWSPLIRIKDIIDEVCRFQETCRKVSYYVFINIIKRKYLIDDINIIDWL